MKKPILFTVIAMFLALVSWTDVRPAAAQNLQQDEDFNKGGRTALQFLKIGLGARQAALGEASIATVRDVNAVFWNPANLSGVERFETSMSYVRWLADMNYTAAAVGARWNRVGVFALSVASLDYGDIQEALVTGPGNDTRTGNTFSGSDLMAGFSFSRAFTDRLSIGMSAKYIHERLFDYSAGTLAFDVGTFYDVGSRGINLAMSAQNFGGSVSWLEGGDRGDQGYDIPLVFRIGVSTDLVGRETFFDGGGIHRLVLSVEAINTNDFSERLHVGTEYVFSDLLMLRGGYRFNYAEGNVSLGAGLTPDVSGVEMRIDYAWVAYEFLDAPHRLSLSVAF